MAGRIVRPQGPAYAQKTLRVQFPLQKTRHFSGARSAENRRALLLDRPDFRNTTPGFTNSLAVAAASVWKKVSHGAADSLAPASVNAGAPGYVSTVTGYLHSLHLLNHKRPGCPSTTDGKFPDSPRSANNKPQTPVTEKEEGLEASSLTRTCQTWEALFFRTPQVSCRS